MLANDCNNCHADLKSEVAATQAKEEQRVTSISEKIEDMTNKIADKYADEIAAIKAAKDAGSKQAPSDELAALWKLQRNAAVLLGFRDGREQRRRSQPRFDVETLDKAEAAADRHCPCWDKA